MSNPFSDIINQNNDRQSKDTLRRVGALISSLGIDTGDGASPLNSPTQGARSDQNRSEDSLESNVQALVQKLKSLLGDFDTSPINDKLAVVQSNLLELDGRPFDTFTRRNLAAAHDASFSGVPEESSLRYIPRTPMSIMQTRPFTSGSRRITSDTPHTNISGGVRKDSYRASHALRSTRYSMGLNIMNNKKFIDTPTSSTTPTSPCFVSPRYSLDHPATPFPASSSGHPPSSTLSALPSASTTTSPAVTAPSIADPSSLPTECTKQTLFAQFCIVDIEPTIISGKKKLDQTNTQPTKTIYTFPEDTPPIVDNLHEYCFPHGAVLTLLHQSEWKVKRHTTYATKFQIMQFTDASNRVYHACCLITTSKLPSGNPSLVRQLEDLKTATLASNAIKRYIRKYIYHKKMNVRSSIAMQWEENMTRSREPSLDPSLSMSGVGGGGSRTGVTGSGKAKHSSGIKSFLSGLKMVMRKKKDPMEKLRSNSLASASFVSSSSSASTTREVDKGGGTWSHFIGGGKPKTHKQRTFSAASASESISGPNSATSTFSFLEDKPRGGYGRAAGYPPVGLFPTSSLASQSAGSTGTQSTCSQALAPPFHSNTTGSAASLRGGPCLPLATGSSHSLTGALTPRGILLSPDTPRSILPIVDDVSIGSSPTPTPRSLLSHFSDISSDDGEDGEDGEEEEGTGETGQPPPPLPAPSSGEDEKDLRALDLHPHGDAQGERRRGQGVRREPAPHFFPTPRSKPRQTKARTRFTFPTSPAKRVLIAQKAYCLLSDAPMPALFFLLLRAIASRDSSRSNQQSIKSFVSSRSLRARSFDGIATPDTAFPSYSALIGAQSTIMRDFLSHLHAFDMSRVHRALDRGMLNLSYPGYVDNLVVCRPLVSQQEWCTAVLVRYIPAKVIAHIHAMLLLEKSLVVLGSEATLVSIICTAFLNLLSPFKWAGIFVPLLPPLAQEILDAPVPFIVGFAAPELFGKEATHRPKADIAPGASLLYLDDFEKYGKLYKPLPTDLQDIRTSITEMEHLLEQEEFVDAPTCKHFEPASATNPELALLVDPSTNSVWKEFTEQLQHWAGRFMAHVQSRNEKEGTQRKNANHKARDAGHPPHHRRGSSASPYGTDAHLAWWPGRWSLTCHWETSRFIKDVLFETDTAVYEPIRRMLQVFQKFNKQFSGGLTEASFAWKQVGTVNGASGFFEVDVERILQPLRVKTIFQEQFLNTQMFTTFADRSYAQYAEQADVRRFIGQWLWYRLQCRKHRKDQSASDS